ncbi:TlpA disulfide reductase family protein [Massilibacteroides sp.]|uniref:TlpA disulfide reductase family protein n=1 Tax=Massilibacteroides sp. TaxID=2034766 RepID=UPI0026117495|nr:TlpA disulfide reductase family protein [Massilibacteroides sp.]MDD4516373.1 TlpA disulfide reductase family protein [Massilibacteroides sp.]
MLKNFFLVFTLLFYLCSCGSNAVYKIEGKLTNLEDPLVYIVYEGSGDNIMDSITCTTPGQFNFELNQEGFNTATLFFENKTKHVTVFLEPQQKASITGNIKYPLLLQVKGSRINEKLSSFYKSISSLIKEETDLYDILTTQETSTGGDTDIAAKLTNVRHQIEESVLSFICDNPKEEASAVLIQSYFIIPDDTRKLDELLAVLDPQIADFYLIKDLSEYSNRAKRTALGAEAPGFSVRNVYGKPFTLDSLTADYKLLAFIAPWCEMCQTDILHLDKVATEYKKKSLDILLISLDDDPKEVRDFLKKDTIQWNIVTDSANQAAVLFDLYNINILPRCFLIDENNKIILKTDNGVEITQTLANLLGDNKK